jgi:hypothetical protein
MNDIFLSYRRVDDRGTTGRLFDHLVAAFGRDAIFYDVEKIPHAVDFRAYIDATIRRCRAVLVVIGPRWRDASDERGHRRLDQPEDAVRLEVEAALRLGKPLIPVLIDDADMPEPAGLPPSIRQLASHNAAPIHNNQYFEQDINALIGDLTRLGVPRVRQGFISDPPAAGLLTGKAARRIGAGLLAVYLLLILAVVGAVGAGAAYVVPKVLQAFQQADQMQADAKQVAALEDDFCAKFNNKDYTGAFQDLTTGYQRRVGDPAKLPTATGGNLGGPTSQFTVTRCQRTGTPFVDGDRATDLVQVDITSAAFGSQTSRRTFTCVKAQGSWKIDNVS